MKMNSMFQRPIFLIMLVFGGLIQVSPAPVHAWGLKSGRLSPFPVPALARQPDISTTADFKGDGQLESVAVTDGHASVLSNSNVVWTSPDSWQVTQAAVTDLDRDGIPEAALVVWRPFRPWPVDEWLPDGGRIRDFHNAQGLSCQLILIGWRRRQYTEVWAGSPLAEPVLAFAAADLSGDGREELITLEGRYADSGLHPPDFLQSAPALDLKVWEWNGFGFSLVSSLTGTTTGMKIIQAADGRNLILTP